MPAASACQPLACWATRPRQGWCLASALACRPRAFSASPFAALCKYWHPLRPFLPSFRQLFAVGARRRPLPRLLRCPQQPLRRWR
eukprot:1666422-Alexandrium_andersonii.AAC.1